MFTPAKRLIMMGRRYKNLVANGNFAIDSDGDGLADGWTAIGINSKDFRVENNTQYWIPITQTYSNGLSTKDSLYPISYVEGHKCYFSTVQKNVYDMYFTGMTGLGARPITDGKFSCIFTMDVTTTSSYARVQSGAMNVESYIKNFIFVDLTAEFCGGVVGTGNEPTAEWCDINVAPFVIY